jgi:rRNA-processing protein FCF1
MSAHLLADANPVIDYVGTNREILALVAAHFESLCILSTVLEEIEDFDASECARLGIRLVEPTLDEVIHASSRRGRLSVQDHLCLLVSRRLRLICVTNDIPLRKACEQEGVEVLWGLELMAALVGAGRMTSEDAIRTAKAIQMLNPFHIRQDIVDRFSRLVSEAESRLR